MNLFAEFMQNYGSTLLYAVITAIAGYIGVVIKNLYTEYVNDKTKRAVVNTCVNAVEQIYKDIHGDEKLDKCLEYASEILVSKGIETSGAELRLLVESAVHSMNEQIKDIEVLPETEKVQGEE